MKYKHFKVGDIIKICEDNIEIADHWLGNMFLILKVIYEYNSHYYEIKSMNSCMYTGSIIYHWIDDVKVEMI